MEIDSPPFPKNSASPKALFDSLRELYNWTASYRDWANMEAQRLNAPEEPFIPELGPEPTSRTGEMFVNLAVPDMFVSWQMLRKIRERYDGIVRNFENEEDWNSDSCIYHRIHTVRVAALLLSVAFLDYERREAKYHDAMKASRKEFLSALKRAIGGLKRKLEGDDDNDNEGIDFNNLFNSEEE
jgi:hypothetical protein